MLLKQNNLSMDIILIAQAQTEINNFLDQQVQVQICWFQQLRQCLEHF